MDKYQGWTNQETWRVMLWLDNERGSHEYWHDAARQQIENAPEDDSVKSGLWTEAEAAKFNLADQLKDEYEEAAFPEDHEPTVFTELLGDALSRVNWHECAEHLIAAVQEADTYTKVKVGR